MKSRKKPVLNEQLRLVVTQAVKNSSRENPVLLETIYSKAGLKYKYKNRYRTIVKMIEWLRTSEGYPIAKNKTSLFLSFDPSDYQNELNTLFKIWQDYNTRYTALITFLNRLKEGELQPILENIDKEWGLVQMGDISLSRGRPGESDVLG